MQEMKDIKLPATGGGTWSVDDIDTDYVVLYFYPKDNTPGCSLEAQDFTALYDDFQKLGVEVVGVSMDDMTSHGKFCEKYDIPYTLLTDVDGKLGSVMGTLHEKSLFGKKILFHERTTFILNRDGEIVKTYKKTKAKNHAEEVLKDVEKLV